MSTQKVPSKGGEPAPEPTPAPTRPPQPPTVARRSQTPRWLWIAGAALVAVVFILIFWATPGGNKRDEASAETPSPTDSKEERQQLDQAWTAFEAQRQGLYERWGNRFKDESQRLADERKAIGEQAAKREERLAVIEERILAREERREERLLDLARSGWEGTPVPTESQVRRAGLPSYCEGYDGNRLTACLALGPPPTGERR